MPPKTLLLGLTILTIVIIIGGVAYTLVEENQGLNTNPSGNGQPTPVSGNSTEPQPQFNDNASTDTTPGTTSSDNNANTNGSDSVLSPNLSAQEQVRDLGMTYLKNTKPETAPLIANISSWTGGMDPLSPEGTIRYLYYSADNAWSVTVDNPSNSTSNFTITGTYNSLTMYVLFTETYNGGTFKLTSYSSQRNPVPPSGPIGP